MKIIDNENEGLKKWFENNKKMTIAISGIVFAAIVALICIFVFSGVVSRGESSNVSGENVNYENGMTSSAIEKETETAELTEASEIEEEEEELARVTSYTGISTEKEDLISLVKNTVKHSNEWVTDCTKKSIDPLGMVSWAISVLDYRSKNGVASTEDVSTSNIDYSFSFTENHNEKVAMTYEQLAGGIGTSIFENIDGFGYDVTGEDQYYLLEMMLNNAYSWDVSKLSGFTITEGNEYTFRKDTNFNHEINFIGEFDYDGTKYDAVIGNIGENYVVFDVVKASELSKIATKIQTNNTATPNSQNSSGATGNAATGGTIPSNDENGQWTDDGYVDTTPVDPNVDDWWNEPDNDENGQWTDDGYVDTTPVDPNVDDWVNDLPPMIINNDGVPGTRGTAAEESGEQIPWAF